MGNSFRGLEAKAAEIAVSRDTTSAMKSDGSASTIQDSSHPTKLTMILLLYLENDSFGRKLRRNPFSI
jgi:hypothetical protein